MTTEAQVPLPDDSNLPRARPYSPPEVPVDALVPATTAVRMVAQPVRVQPSGDAVVKPIRVRARPASLPAQRTAGATAPIRVSASPVRVMGSPVRPLALQDA